VSLDESLDGWQKKMHTVGSIHSPASLPDAVEGWTRAAFVRNPYDRWHSWYYAATGGARGAFAEWLRDFPVGRDKVCAPQHRFVASKGEFVANFIGRYEHFEDSFSEMARLCGSPSTLKSPNRGVNGYGRTRERMVLDYEESPEAAELVRELSKGDFKVFGYSELPPQ
jgi:hypothetical protein